MNDGTDGHEGTDDPIDTILTGLLPNGVRLLVTVFHDGGTLAFKPPGETTWGPFVELERLS